MSLVIFLLLQIADVLTTLACMHYGGTEGNPIAAYIILKARSPILGMLWIKVMAAWVGAVIYNSHRPHLLKILNYMFTAIVCWNLLILCVLMAVRS